MSQEGKRALLVLSTGTLMVVLDTTAVNVALPTIRSELRLSVADLAWVVNAYLISFGGLLLLAGRLGDLLSKRAVFLAGLGLFTAASLACGLAPSATALLAARFGQGIGAAFLSAVVLGMIVELFPTPAARARAIGIYSFVLNVGGAIGLLAGGALTEFGGWHLIFFVNVPVGILAILAGQRWLPADLGPGLAGGADFAGAALITASLMLGVYAIVGPATTRGWGDPITIASAGAAAALFGAFVGREARTRTPLVPLAIFRIPCTRTANLVQALLTAGMFGLFFVGALYLKRVLDYDALQLGLAFLPLTVVIAAVSLGLSDRVILRFGAAPTLVPSLTLVAAGLLLFTRAPVNGDYAADVLPVLLLLATGVGFAFPAVMSLAVSGAGNQDAGLASGLINTSVQVGGALGLATLAAIATGETGRLRADGQSNLQALNGGYHLAYLVCAGFVLVAAGLALAAAHPWRAIHRSTAHERSSGEPLLATPATDPKEHQCKP